MINPVTNAQIYLEVFPMKSATRRYQLLLLALLVLTVLIVPAQAQGDPDANGVTPDTPAQTRRELLGISRNR